MKISLPIKTDDRPAIRRGPMSVLGESGPPNGSGSPRGSTYYKRLRKCPREHALAKEALLSPIRDDNALTIGILFHAGLEAYYRAQLNGADKIESERACWDYLKPVMTEPGYGGSGPGDDADTWPTVERCLASYFDRWRDVDRWRVIAVEETIGLRWDGLEYSARLDLMIENLDDHGFYVIEHKSSKSITSDLIEGYQLDLQTLGQVWLARKCLDLKSLPPFRGMMVNITSKHVKPQHQRVLVCPSDAHLRAWEHSMSDWTKLAELMKSLGYPQALGTCTGPDRGYRRCSFFELCHSWPESSVEDWKSWDPPEGFVRVTSEHTDAADWTNEVST